jgi:HAD superfamily hydrolase (TIGR01509 family)
MFSLRMQALEAVVFDMDGVIFDTERVYMNATKLALRELRSKVSDELLHSLVGLSSAECDVLLLKHLGSSSALSDFTEAYVRWKAMELERSIPVKAGAAELLRYLRHAGIPTAVATGAVRSVASEYLDRSMLGACVSLIVTRDDVSRPKPAPDIFLAAAAGLGVDPDHCLAIEDSGPGVAAAHAAGMITLLVPDILTPGRDIRVMCDAILPDLWSVLAYACGRIGGDLKG